MYLKNRITSLGLVFLAVCCFVSCRQKENGAATEKTNQVPISVNDSSFSSIDRSPMDMSYFPRDYPKEKMTASNLENLVARVIYSRPQKNGRRIFADSTTRQDFIQHYGKEWRLGANEATEIEFFKNVTISGKQFPKGRYVLYCIPYPDKWKIIFNGNLFSWGLHMDKTKDIAEIELAVSNSNTDLEFFTMIFQDASYGCDLVMGWGNTKVVMPINFN
ncbi:MAG TPA: DUF2911 domain-containing protein [Ferruginibacter sp.]|nr:DUF2911 domain-containing protein [Ferruginibacter sp.]